MSLEKRKLWKLLTDLAEAMRTAKEMGLTLEAQTLEQVAERVREKMEAAP